jgi:hypothetical protein
MVGSALLFWSQQCGSHPGYLGYMQIQTTSLGIGIVVRPVQDLLLKASTLLVSLPQAHHLSARTAVQNGLSDLLVKVGEDGG